MNIDEVIHELKTLDLSTYPHDEIVELMKYFGPTAWIAVQFYHTKSMIRARPNGNTYSFNKSDDLSFKPQNLNTTYQRASTPLKTMFYAGVLPEEVHLNQLTTARIIGLLESMPSLRSNNNLPPQKITFGKWQVKEGEFLNLLAIVNHDDFYNQSTYTQELVDAYEQFIKQHPPEIAEKSFKIANFLSYEFAKQNIENDYDYMISAVFSEIVSSRPNIDGIFYPSVRTEGQGFNITIKPESIHKIELVAVGECTVEKNNNVTTMTNNKSILLQKGQVDFDLNT